MIDIGDGVVLEPLQERHAAACAAAIEENRARLARWMPWADASRSIDDVRAFIASVDERRANERGAAYAILVHGVFAGSVDLHDVNRAQGLGQIGYWIAAAFGGRGVMTRAVRALTERGFTQERLHRIEILAAIENAPSRAVAERAGFRFEATLRSRLRTQRGYEDAALYARIAGDRA
jgi:ribosomal-protein-serine acetyltransferase